MNRIEFKVNGKLETISVEPRETLLDILRDKIGLTGAKKGCDEAICGCCAVLLNGKPICSCNMLAVEADGSEITTIEGLGDPENNSTLDQLQRAFIKNDAMQCAFCTSGQIISSKAFIMNLQVDNKWLTEVKGVAKGNSEDNEDLETEIKEALSGNLCRCGCYNNIVAAVKEVALATPNV